MSPSDIEVLLHCHCMPGPHPRSDAPAVMDALDTFLKAGLIEPRDDSRGGGFGTTDGGVMLVKALCDVQFPVRRWVMP